MEIKKGAGVYIDEIAIERNKSKLEQYKDATKRIIIDDGGGFMPLYDFSPKDFNKDFYTE